MKYKSLNRYLKNKYKKRVLKVTLKAGFSCPNRDGTKGYGGCSFCSEENLVPQAYLKNQNISHQLETGINLIKEHVSNPKVIAYFQDHSATYADVKTLEKLYNQAIKRDEVVVLSIGTRPDCLNQDIIDLVNNYTEKVEVWIELGLQTSNDDLLKQMNRQHTVKDFLNASEKILKTNVKLISHVIIGIPGQTDKDIIDTAKLINSMSMFGVKLHNLHVLKNTLLAKTYSKNKFHILTLKEYSEKAALFISYLNKNITIHRLAAYANKKILLAPTWCSNRFAGSNEIVKHLETNNIFQGINL